MIKTKHVKLISEGTKGRFAQCVADVVQFNNDHGIEHEHMPTMSNLFYHGLCLAGEAGEVANVIKKIWRDGDSEASRKHLEEEIVDMAIFMGMLVKISGMDFDAAWEAKHRELYERWADKNIGKRKVDMVQFTDDHILTDTFTGEIRIGAKVDLTKINVQYEVTEEEAQVHDPSSNRT